MSVVDNYVLKTCSGVSKRFVTDLNKKLHEDRPGGAGDTAFILASGNATVGGPKAMEMDIYLAALNYVGPDVVVEIIRPMVEADGREHFPWGYYEGYVELFVKQQHDESNRLVRVFPEEKLGDKEL